MPTPAAPVDPARALPIAEAAEGERLVPTFCRPNCFGGCPIFAHVRDGKVVKTSFRPLPDPQYNRICLRGLSQPQQQYSERRLLHPKKRVGPRGSGQWEQITWDEALATVVEKFQGTIAEHGPQAIAYTEGTGSYGILTSSHFGATTRFFNALDATTLSNTLDVAQAHGLMQVFGNLPNNDPADFVNAETIFIVGSNLTEAQIHSWHFVADAMDKGAKLYVVDPVYTVTASKADTWVRIRPGSDTAMFLAMTHIVLVEGLQDDQYLHDSTVAPLLVREDDGQFLRAHHLTGAEPATHTDPMTGQEVCDEPFLVWSADTDELVELQPGVRAVMTGTFEAAGTTVRPALDLLKDTVAEWTPEKAEEFTTIPADTLREMAVRYATSRPATIYHCMGIDHWDNGHLNTLAESALACVTGNIGKPGAALGFKWYYAENYDWMAWMMPGGHTGRTIYTDDMFEVATTGKIRGEDDAIKALYVAGCNPLGAYCDRNKWISEVLPTLDFIVTVDIYNSDTVEYSDLVLPAAHWFEREDMQFANNHPFMIYAEQAVEPLGESRPDIDILRDLAGPLGIKEFFPDSNHEIFEISLNKPWAERIGLTIDRVKEEGAVKVWYQDPDQPNVCLGFDGTFPTPSGRAEFYNPNPRPRVLSTTSMHYDAKRERLPYFSPPVEAWPGSEASKKYPLVFFQEHTRWRVHTQYAEVPMLRELDPEPTVKINPKDAERRGIADGDDVEIFNDRGHVVVKAVFSNALPEGMLSMPKGWLAHQHKAGAPSELTHMRLNPASINQSYFDVAVDVRVWKEA